MHMTHGLDYGRIQWFQADTDSLEVIVTRSVPLFNICEQALASGMPAWVRR